MIACMTEAQNKQEFLDRLSRAIERSRLDDIQIASQLGISKQAFSQIRSGERPGWVHREKIAKILGVDERWLTFGDLDHAPSWASHARGFSTLSTPANSGSGRAREGLAAQPIPVVGTVVAGDGQFSDRSAYVQDGGTPLVIPDTWQAVMVEGMSAYPVVYPGQIVLIDTERGARPDGSDWGEAQMTDLHDNLVLVETDEPPDIGEATSGHRAYLKRFCLDKRAPDGFVLASIDSGRSSPYVPANRILMIVPVVGVLFQDPRRPREKRWHAKTVVATIHP